MQSSSPTSSSVDFSQKTNRGVAVTHSSTLLKLGDGIMNRNWNPRYFMLRGSTLQYFTNPRDSRPKEIIDILGAEIVWLGEYLGRPFCIGIEPAVHRALQISGSSLEESKQWMRWLQEAADPAAYSSLPQGLEAMSPSSLRNQFSRTSDFFIPSDLPPQLADAAKTLEKAVTTFEAGKPSKTFALVDVIDGARIFGTTSGHQPTAPDKMLLYGMIGLLLSLMFKSLFVPFLIVAVLTMVFERFSNRPDDGSRADVCLGIVSLHISSGGTRNWLLDASRYPLWMARISQAFTTPTDVNHDTVHYVFRNGEHVSLRRYRWELDDGSVCLVASGEGSIYEGFFLRRQGIDETRVFYVCSNPKTGMSASDRVRSVITGLGQISIQVGDHDGSGIPRPPPGAWTRHHKGGIVSHTGGHVDTSSLSLVRAVLFGRKKLALKSVFPPTGKSPVKSLGWLLSGFDDESVRGSRSATLAVINSLSKAASALAESAFTTHHPRLGETALSWIGTGEKAPQIFLEVTEASRPSSGLAAAVRVSVTGHNWSVRGVIKYTVSLDAKRNWTGVRISFNGSELELIATKSNIRISLPDVIIGSKNRVFWEGVLRVTEQGPSHTTSVVIPIGESGSFSGIISDGNGRKLHAIDGHWLECVYIDNELVWTYGVSAMGGPIVLKKLEEEVKDKAVVAPVVRMSSADEEAMVFIQRLRQEIPELKNQASRIDDGYLYRFSKARQFVFDDAKDMLTKHIEWIEKNKVSELLAFEFPELPEVKAAFPHGYHGIDRHGRPIYISRLAKTDQERLFQVTDWDRFLKFWIQSYEDLIFNKIPACTRNGGKNPQLPGLPPPSALAPLQTLTILDLKGVGLSHLNMRVKEFIERSNAVSSSNYPEILGAMYIVNAPGVFPLIWNAIKGMIDPGTRSKMHVLTSKQTKDKLLEVIDADQLPHFLGGACRCDASAGESEDSDYGCLSSDKGPWLQ